MLREGRIDQKEWDEIIFPAIQKGKLKERNDLQYKGLLVVYELFDTVIEDIDGNLYHCDAWAPPHEKPYVNVTRYGRRKINIPKRI